MAMMAKMRSLAPAFIITVGAIFVLFMVLSDSSVMEIFGLRTNNIGSINGVNITYQQFMKDMDNIREQQKQQTGKDVDENSQFRDQVWNDIVTRVLLDQEIKKLGITVTDNEIRSVILGKNPPEFLKKYFIDSTGKFDRQRYISALYNPQNSQPLLQAEAIVKQNLLNQKLQSMLMASITISNAEVRRQFVDQNIKMNDQYVLVGTNEIPDASIKISDADLKDYYNNHLSNYEIKAKRKVKYVLFPTVPSAADSQNVKLTLEDIAGQMGQDTVTFKKLVNLYSSKPYSKDTLAINAFRGSTADSILNAKPGSVIGPVLSGENYILYHYIGSVPSKETMVRASHILINQYGNDKKNLEEAMKIYNELKGGANFAEMAKKYSKDPGSAMRGGNLGWFGKGQMVPAFEKAAFSGRIGEIQKPIKTQYGYHIIKVTGRNDRKYIVEELVNPIKASSSTKDQLLSNAKDFSYIAKKDGFEKEAKLMDYNARESEAFTKDAYYIPGIGISKNLIKWAFDNSVGDISDPITSTSGYLVAMVSGVINEGVKPFSEVKNSIKPLVMKEKKFEAALKKASEIKNKVGQDLSKAVSMDPHAVVKVTGMFSANSTIPGIGSDFNFVEHSLKEPVNKVSQPFKGNRGYYLIKVLTRTPFDTSAYKIQQNTIRANLLRQKENSFFSEWIASLKKNADIVDHRSQFFGL